MGGVSEGTRPDGEGEGAGIVRWITCSILKRCEQAMHAPAEPILIVFVNSRKSPAASVPRTNKGTCKRRRGDPRRSTPFIGLDRFRVSVAMQVPSSTADLVLVYSRLCTTIGSDLKSLIA